MKITVQRINQNYLMEGKNEKGNIVRMDNSLKGGGNDEGATPMELLIMALGGCSSIDVISILKKQRQDLQDISVMLDAERETGKDANLFTKIHIHFTLKGNLEQQKIERAIELSLTKYCSVAKTLEKTAVITSSYEIQ